MPNSTLWVTGDSFSFSEPDDDNPNVWFYKVANDLGFTLKNYSQAGVSQDWSWEGINRLRPNLTKDDQLLIVLTHPSRYWFFEDRPGATNIHIADIDKVIEPERLKAAELYIKHIQRMQLDSLQLEHRLGWLNHMVTIHGWRKPIILLAFDQFIEDRSLYPGLTFANGCLNDIADGEPIGPKTYEFRSSLFKGRDVRYNHMCLSNHAILADKIKSYMTEGKDIDLTTGFIADIIDRSRIDDSTFVENELCKARVEVFKQSKNEFRVPWAEKLGLRK